MAKKRNIKLNKDETLESIEEELQNAIQFLDSVNQKISETLKLSQKEDPEKQNLENSTSTTTSPENTPQ